MLAAITLVTLSACADESLSGYAETDTVYRLQTLDGEPFAASATLTLPERGSVAGDAPCNAYSAAQTAPYPWFEIGPIRATKRACPDLDDEQRFFDALEVMTIAEVSGPTLLLSNDDGREMTFAAD